MKLLQVFKKLIAATGQLLVKSLHAIGAIIILGCGVFVSFGHTVTLYVNGAGYQSLQSIVIAVSFETMFIMSSAVMISRKMKGLAVPKYTKNGFWFGLVIVAWGNIRYSLRPEAGIAANVEGVLLEIAVVAIVFFAEAIFGEAVSEATGDQEEKTEVETDPKETKHPQTKQTLVEDKKRLPIEPWPMRHQNNGQQWQADHQTQSQHTNTQATVRTPSHSVHISRINYLLDEKDKQFMQENENTFLVCAQHLDETGELLSIRRLADLAETKESRSRRVIDIIKMIQRGGQL